MSNPNMVPMLAPDGTAGYIPSDRVTDALKQGGKLGVEMQAPDGTHGIIPRENLVQGIQSGGKVIHDSAQYTTKFEQDRNPDNQPGIIHSAASELGTLVKGAAGMSPTGPEAVGQFVQSAAKVGTDDINRRADQRSVPYRAVAATGSLVGVNAAEMEKQADVGNWRGVIGTAAGDAAPVVAAEALKTPAAQKVIGNSVTALKGMADFEAKQAAAMRKVVPEAANLPDKAIAGAEDVFRAAAPTGMNKGFRSNLYAAAGDLADIARKVDVAEAKGGIVKPDTRVRATVDAIRDHQAEMYQTERAPQIQRNADTPLEVGTNANSRNGLEYIQKTAGDVADAQIAQKALDDKQLTVQEADRLSILVNKTLLTFEKATPEVKMQLQMTNPKVGGLKALDTELGRNLNETLMDAGEPGLRDYERRYAGLSAVRDQLESRMNAVELERQNIGKYAKVLTGGKEGIASASQAAVSSVNIGRKLQTGFKSLADSGITAKK